VLPAVGVDTPPLPDVLEAPPELFEGSDEAPEPVDAEHPRAAAAVPAATMKHRAGAKKEKKRSIRTPYRFGRGTSTREA
jgi:hypothetical protein